MKAEVVVSGMTCGSCAVHVKQAFERAGASEVRVDWRSGRAEADTATMNREALDRALTGTRYAVEEIRRTPGRHDNDRDPGRDTDLVVIGSGGGAFAAAIRARDLGKRVTMIEHGITGGTCVNVGCIPSKALLADAKQAGGEHARLAVAVQRKADLVDSLRQDKYVDLIDAYDIDFRNGNARLTGPHTVTVDGESLSADAILVAAGAHPSAPPIEGLEDAGYLTSTSALEVTELPKRLAVLGTGSVGLELGQMFGMFGAHVTFITRRNVASTTEPEVSEAIRGVLEDEGHTVIDWATTSEVRGADGEKVLLGTRRDGSSFEARADEILVATGRRPNTDGLGLAEAGVELDTTGAVVVDTEQRTSVPSIFAAGDVTTQPQYVYVAAAGGAAAAENALADGTRRLDFAALPRMIFTFPQIASAGLTEAQARDQGLDIRTTVLPLSAIPRALVNGDTRGLIKLVAEADSGRLVGASALAEAAGEVIYAAVLAIEHGLTIEQLAGTWAPYLTMAEGLRLAAQTFDRDVAQLSCCAA
ncbi:MAG: mercury(II) reductase [Thermoleophilaceae bacterium]